MNKIIFTIAFFGCIFLQAQTKLIQHCGLNGSNAEFLFNYNNEEIPNANLGLTPTELTQTSQLDNLIFINKTAAIIVTSLFCFVYSFLYTIQVHCL